MNFIDGHVPAMAILSLVLGGIIFVVRNRIKRNREARSI
jgi:hypothetical protein